MKLLKDKNVFFVLSGTKRCSLVPKMIEELINNGAKVHTFLTKDTYNFVDIRELKEIKDNTLQLEQNYEKAILPLEDVVITAPCNFNTFNAIANNQGDNYPLHIITKAIRKKKKVILALDINPRYIKTSAFMSSIKKLEKKCTIIWPEIDEEKVAMSPPGKILDTIYSNMCRIKYISQRKEISEDYYNLVENNFDQFHLIGKVLFEKALTHNTAGCISTRTGGGFLITSSGVNLGNVKEYDLAFVSDAIPEKNVIIWEGIKKPSSETPLHWFIYNKNRAINAIIHCHSSKITYSKKLEKFATKHYVRYGTFKLSDEVYNLLEKNDNFAIMRLHGEVAVGNNLEEAFLKIKSKLEDLI